MPKPAPKSASTNCCVKNNPAAVIYGIPNCDNCRKARKWFEQQGIDYRFHDVRAAGLTTELVTNWLQHLDEASLVNTRSTTWRGLAEEQRGKLGSETVDLLVTHPTLLKRPLIAGGSDYSVGYDEARWKELFK
jgi:arsenate reductase